MKQGTVKHFLLLLPLFCGWIVMCGCGSSHIAKVDMTEKNAKIIIPDGMQESEVYSVLGGGCSITTASNNVKSLIYLFPFLGEPPKVNPKMDMMTVVISNGFVIERHFGEKVL